MSVTTNHDRLRLFVDLKMIKTNLDTRVSEDFLVFILIYFRTMIVNNKLQTNINILTCTCVTINHHAYSDTQTNIFGLTDYRGGLNEINVKY